MTVTEAPPVATEMLTCSNCGGGYRPDDVFCESCGLDFATGSLPGGDDGNAAVVGVDEIVVEVDVAWFERAVTGGELALPQPMPEPQRLPLMGLKALIGRTSSSRGVFPEIDVRALTGDPAVSTRHAMIERRSLGEAWTITDVGSTNGTLVGADLTTATEIPAGEPTPLGPGVSAWVGAWTRLILVGNDSGR